MYLMVIANNAFMRGASVIGPKQKSFSFLDGYIIL